MENKKIFDESCSYMPGGVNSPVRAFKGLDTNPPVISSGSGSIIVDEEGKKYIDFVGAWGPMILGHDDGDVVKAITDQARKGIAFGAPTNLELELARLLCTTLDDFDMVRMVNSGTEATMSAIKLARGYTNRNIIVKFAGCYHGHYDGFLISAGSGVMTNGIPGSAGVPEESIKNTVIADYNSIESIDKIFDEYGKDIAGVILEPVAGNMGVIPSSKDFLQRLRELCDKYSSLLIFDEVMSGFRVSYKGAQSLYNISPDLKTYAKIMSGGLPSGAYGGKREIMECLSPLGPVYQAGTMSGNPIVMAAGIATLQKLNKNPEIYDKINRLGEKLENGLVEISKEKNIGTVINRCGGMMTMFFTDRDSVSNYEEAKECNIELFNKYFLHMLDNGINIAPSQFEAIFISAAHTEEHIDKYLEAYKKFIY